MDGKHLNQHLKKIVKQRAETATMYTKAFKQNCPSITITITVAITIIIASTTLVPLLFMLKCPSQPVCTAAVCYFYHPGDIISFTVQMTRFVRIFHPVYVLRISFQLPSKKNSLDV